jgi:hypothetical protein
MILIWARKKVNKSPWMSIKRGYESRLGANSRFHRGFLTSLEATHVELYASGRCDIVGIKACRLFIVSESQFSYASCSCWHSSISTALFKVCFGLFL